MTVAALVAALVACQTGSDDYFDLSASERLQQTIDEVSRVLRSSEHGWEFEYYPDDELSYGGIVYIVRFDSLTATVACSLVPDSVETTYYKMTNDNGPVLTFDTYNSLLHYFATPSSAAYEAKGGEFEFVVSQLSDTLITLYGKKTRNNMTLRRLKTSSEGYAERTVSVFDSFLDSYEGTLCETPVAVSVELSSRRLTLAAAGDTVDCPFAFNERGISLYRPVRVGQAEVQHFNYVIDTLRVPDKRNPAVLTDSAYNCFLVCTDATALGDRLQGIDNPSRIAYRSFAGNYLLRYNSNASNVRVSLMPNRIDGTYLMTGLNSHYNLVLQYDYTSGNLMLAPQVVGEVNGRTVYFVTYSSTVGSLWLTDQASFTLTWNGNRVYSAYNFSATNPGRYACDSGLLVMVYYNDEGVLTASLLDDADWMVNGSAQLGYLTTLQKLRN